MELLIRWNGRGLLRYTIATFSRQRNLNIGIGTGALVAMVTVAMQWCRLPGATPLWPVKSATPRNASAGGGGQEGSADPRRYMSNTESTRRFPVAAAAFLSLVARNSAAMVEKICSKLVSALLTDLFDFVHVRPSDGAVDLRLGGSGFEYRPSHLLSWSSPCTSENAAMFGPQPLPSYPLPLHCV